MNPVAKDQQEVAEVKNEETMRIGDGRCQPSARSLMWRNCIEQHLKPTKRDLVRQTKSNLGSVGTNETNTPNEAQKKPEEKLKHCEECLDDRQCNWNTEKELRGRPNGALQKTKVEETRQRDGHTQRSCLKEDSTPKGQDCDNAQVCEDKKRRRTRMRTRNQPKTQIPRNLENEKQEQRQEKKQSHASEEEKRQRPIRSRRRQKKNKKENTEHHDVRQWRSIEQGVHLHRRWLNEEHGIVKFANFESKILMRELEEKNRIQLKETSIGLNPLTWSPYWKNGKFDKEMYKTVIRNLFEEMEKNKIEVKKIEKPRWPMSSLPQSRLKKKKKPDVSREDVHRTFQESMGQRNIGANEKEEDDWFEESAPETFHFGDLSEIVTEVSQDEVRRTLEEALRRNKKLES